MRRLAILVVGAILAAGGAGYLLLQRTSPEKPSQVWVKGRGAGETVRLFASGRFERSTWCDVCAPDNQSGTWSSTGSTITLHTKDQQAIVLSHIQFRGCNALASEGLPRFPTDVFFLDSDSCGDAL